MQDGTGFFRQSGNSERQRQRVYVKGAGIERSAEISLAARGDKAVITIEDSGPGIPEEMMSHVFEPFFRAAPGRTRTIKGSGLGLAIAKEIIERAGGVLTIENRPQGGLRQTISFNRVSK